ncbi:calcineurin-binding protein cabin-1-like isoform X2 [Aethina tumida]|uniref:calcineurin-binding protein cabin-1-like isoform X2 n=1 Tax=Aethina tumida TaxID=116153 RepID=UPI0021499596|nr:calcineurin-binding protein cabin-1-like isoform X2 [Aethina tumida]
MLKIKALNREASSDEEVPVIRKEAQEEIALELYNKSLRLRKAGDLQESESILIKLIEENIPLLENNGGLPKSMSTLKYSCYLNLGDIYLNKENIAKALEQYLTASELDGDDVTLWYNIGNLSLKEGKFRQSAYAFSRGLECSEYHWPCLDNLISVLFAIRDTISCLCYIGKALIRDPDYTKGLVIRAQIYRDNPGTKDYYKLYNPEHVWEPSLDIKIAEEDEVYYLKEADELRQRVLEVEKSLSPKYLQEIPLPKPLEEYTWVSLAKTVVHLHQYLTDNDMSHFTLIDMSKCMSLTEAPPKQPLLIGELLEQAQKSPEKVNESPKEQPPASSDEKMEAESIIERRFSQTSETTTNNDGQENTPVQTDNDEPMEQDTEDQDENDTSKSEKTKPSRGSKRKRDLLLDLKVWGWHSKRKYQKKGNKEKDISIEDALNRIIPKYLLENKITSNTVNISEESMNTMDLYKMYVDEKEINFISPIQSPKSGNTEHYFGTNAEKEDVLQLWTKPRTYTDTVVLIKDFVITISKFWHIKWPKELIDLYVEAYKMYREHYDVPQIFSGDCSFEDMRDDALATLLYGELVNFTLEGKEVIHISNISFLQHISGWHEDWKEEYVSFFNRVYWLRAHLFRMENDNDLAARSLLLVEELINEEEKKSADKYFLYLPNCMKFGIITSKVAEKILKHLDVVNSLGTVQNLYKEERYVEVAEIIKATFSLPGSNSIQVGRVGRPAQLGFLLHSLWFTNTTDCFIWTEECFKESLDNYLKPNKDYEKWEGMVQKCLSILQEIIKSDTVSILDVLNEDKRKRLVESLCKIICKQMNSLGTMPLDSVSPWILLHYVLLREEHRKQASKKVCHIKKDQKSEISETAIQNDEPESDDVPPSIRILFSAHEFLGPREWCLTGNGELLHFILDTILDRLDTPIFDHLREKIDIHIEQSLFCLYQYPTKSNKVSRHLADHNVTPLHLTWERGFQLYEFYVPTSLPEFNSFKNESISTDLKDLLKRIIGLVPPENDPKQTLSKVNDFLTGKSDTLPEVIEFPNKIRAIYYLIGDYHFKQKEFIKCMKYFQMDICINPHRLDSWACLGLGYSSQLDNKLNFCKKIKSESEFLDIAKSAQTCFRKALSLAPERLILWIECGSFEYMVHSYCSRLLKFESEKFSMEKFELLESQKEHYLDSSGTSLENAIALYEDNDNETDERWLQYYIIGKIAEKKQKEPTEYLQYYVTASNLLHENSATYPEKINYNNPQHLAVEALELHYRINASVLKYLESNEGKDIPHTLGTFFKKCLRTTLLTKISKVTEKPQLNVPVTSYSQVSQPQSVISTSQVPQSQAVAERSSFQEQCLNPTNKQPDDGKSAAKTELEESITESVVKCQRSEEVIEQPEKMECDKPDEEDVTDIKKEIKEECAKEVKSNKEEEPLKVVAEIVILSDSDDEIVMTSQTEEGKKYSEEIQKQREELERKQNEQTENVIKEESKGFKGEPKTTSLDAKDVQQVLDEMMRETMRKTEQEAAELDSDKSFTDEKKETSFSEVMDLNINNSLVKMEIDQPKEVDTVRENVPSMEVDRNNIIKMEVNNDLPEKSKTDERENEKTASERSKSESGTEGIRTSLDDDDSSSSSGSSSSSSTTSGSDSDDTSSSSTTTTTATDNENLSNSEILSLVDKCIAGLELCIQRLPQNYKALYRLAHVYYNYKAKKDFSKSKQLLLSQYKCSKDGVLINGLFSERKPNNFFNNIWRIPSTEIDRPGSLAAHMNRCLSLLLQILQRTNDNKTLMDLCIQLRKTPDQDKIYIKDSDRLAFSDQALEMCIQSLRSQVKNIQTMSYNAKVKLLQDIFRVHQRVSKHYTAKESVFASMLSEAYKKFKDDKLPENVNPLDCAIKFCQQNKVQEKTKTPIATTPSLPRSPGLAIPPVLPSPTAVPSTSSTPLKRPGMGRPRGRPPLPKVPGQPKPSRGRSSSSTNYSYNLAVAGIMKQYQDMYTQYQMQQFNQFLAQGSLTNPYGSVNLANQFLATQSNLLLPGNLGKTMGSTDPQMPMAPLMDSLKKKSGHADVSSLLADMNNEQLNYLQSLTYASMNKPTTTKNFPSSSRKNISSPGNKMNVPTTKAAMSTSSALSMGSSMGKQYISSATTTSTKSVTPGAGIKYSPSTVTSTKMNLPSTSGNQTPKSRPSSAILSKPYKYAASDVPQLLGTGITKSGSQMFKEPSTSILKNTMSPSTMKSAITSSPTKVHHSVPKENPGVYLKERPSISITPVTSTATPPVVSTASFVSPSIPSSPGKTLQEKLADKQKQHQHSNKAQSKHMESPADIFTKEHISSANLMKSLNLTNLPSSLSVSKAVVSSPQLPPGLSISAASNVSTSHYRTDLGMSHPLCMPKYQEPILPPSLSVSKASVPVSSSIAGKFQQPMAVPKDQISPSYKQKQKNSTQALKKGGPTIVNPNSGMSINVSPTKGPDPNKESKTSMDLTRKSEKIPKISVRQDLVSSISKNVDLEALKRIQSSGSVDILNVSPSSSKGMKKKTALDSPISTTITRVGPSKKETKFHLTGTPKDAGSSTSVNDDDDDIILVE